MESFSECELRQHYLVELLLTFHATVCNKCVCPRPQGHLLGPEPPTVTVQLGTTRALHCESSQNVSQFTWTFNGMPVRVQGDPDEIPCKKRVCPYPQGHLSSELTFVACDECEV